MLTIGITGGTGSGKSHIAELFAQHGGETVDADVVYHKLLGICHGMKNDILALFPEAADVHGNINRRKLASIVFTNDKALTDLNAVTHGYIIDEVEQIIAEYYRCNVPFVCIDAIALFESGVNDMCDVTVGVIAPKEARIARIMARDNLDRARALTRVNAQKDDSFYEKKCDYIIENNDDERLHERVEEVYCAIMNEME